MKISASFLSIKNDLKNNIKLLDQTNIDYLHLDIMDGRFVSNKTLRFRKLKSILDGTESLKDVHLMVRNVKKYIKKYKKLKPEYITFHLEATKTPLKIINILRKNGIKVGISIKPNTNIEDIRPYLSLIDLVLVMSVEPGEGGQEFIPSSIDKIKYLDDLRNKNDYKYVIEVDGGINDTNYYLLKANNVDIIVIGSFITNSDNYQERIDKLKC